MFSRWFCVILVVFLSRNAQVHAQCSVSLGKDTISCIGHNFNFITQLTGNAPYTFAWSGSAGLSCTTCPNPVLIVSGPETITLTVTDANGCTSTDQLSIQLTNIPNADFNFTSSDFCSGSSVNYTNNSTGGPLNYFWNFGEAASSTNLSNAENPTHVYTAFGSTVRNFRTLLTVVNAYGCRDTISKVIDIKEKPNGELIDLNNGFRNCGGGIFDMTVRDLTQGGGIATYSINWGDGSANFTTNSFPAGGVNHVYTTNEVFDLEYVVTGINGCSDTSIYNIANITNPAVGAANPGGTSGCGPLDLCFPLNNFSANHSTTYYVVDFGDGTEFDTLPHPPPATVCHTYTEASCGLPGNQYIFTIRALNLCEESAATISPIRVYRGPEAQLDSVPIFGCINQPININNPTIPGFNASCSTNTLFTWDFGNSTGATVATNNGQTPVYTNPGNYTVSLSAQNNCLTSTATTTICVEAPPTPNFTVSTVKGCAPLTIQLSDISTRPNDCSSSILWNAQLLEDNCSSNPSPFQFVNGTTTTSSNPSILFASSGRYRVRLQIQNSCGVFQKDTIVEVGGLPIGTIDPLTSVCPGIPINPNLTLNSCYTDTTFISWSTTGNPIQNSTSISPTFEFTTSGTKTISVQLTNSCGTINTDETIEILPAPNQLAPTVASPICTGSNLTLNLTGTTNGFTVSWTGPNGFTSTLENPVLTNVQTSNEGYYFVQASSSNCFGPLDSVLVTVRTPPVITASANPTTICEGDTTTLSASGGVGYLWSPAIDLNQNTGANVLAFPTTSTQFTVVGTDGFCESSATVEVVVNPLPTVNAGPDTTVCINSSTLLFTGTPNGGQWSGNKIDATGIFTPDTPGSFPIQYDITDVNGCAASDERIVSVTTPVQASVAPDFNRCVQNSDTLLVGSPAGGIWTGTGVQNNGMFSLNQAGIYKLTYSAGSGNCATKDSISITLHPNPTVQIMNDTTLCFGTSSIALTASPSGGVWSGNFVNANAFQTATAPTGSHIVQYTFIDNSTNCGTTENATITIPVVVDANAGPDSTICNQTTAVQFNGLPVGGIWTGNGISSTGEYIPTTNGTFTFEYTFTTVNGCSSRDEMTLSVGSAQTIQLPNDTSICLNSNPIRFSASPNNGNWNGNYVSANGTFTPTEIGSSYLVYRFGTGTCLVKDSLRVQVNGIPQITLPQDFTTCLYGDDTPLVASPSTGTWSGNGIVTSANATVFSPSIAGIGTHVIGFTTTDVNGCTNDKTMQIEVAATIQVNAGNDTTICNTTTPVIFVGTPSGGNWSGVGISNNGTFTPNGTGNFRFYYSVIGGGNCVFTDSVEVTVIEPPTVDARGDWSVCLNSFELSLNGIPSTGIWSGAHVTPNGQFNPNTVGTFHLIYTVGTGNCAVSDDINVEVKPLPIVDAGTNKEVCVSAAPLQVIGTPNGGNWSGLGMGSTGTFSPSIAGVGIHLMSYSYEDPTTFCLNTDTLRIRVVELPIPQFDLIDSICSNVATTLINNSTGANSYNWNFGNGDQSSLPNPTVVYTESGSYTVELMVRNSFGCTDSSEQIIKILEQPKIGFQLTQDQSCSPSVVSFSNLSSGSNLTYSWNLGNGTTSNLRNPNPVTYTEGTRGDTVYYTQLNISNQCGSLFLRDTIEVLGHPKANFGTKVDEGCSPVPVDIINLSTGPPNSYFWDYGDGTTSTNSDNFQQHEYTVGENDTTYILKLIVQNTCGIDSISKPISLQPNQLISFFNTDKLIGCAPHRVQFTQFTQGSTRSYWTFGDGNVSDAFSPSHTFTKEGKYIIQLLASNDCNKDSSKIEITVLPQPEILFDIKPLQACQGAEFSYQNLSSGLSSVIWKFGDGDSSNLQNPKHIYQNSGLYTVALTGSDGVTGCSATKTQDIVVNPLPDFTVSGNPTSGCKPLDVNFQTTTTGTTFLSWDFGDGGNSINKNPSHTFFDAGIYSVNCVATNEFGCKDSIQLNINVYDLPVVKMTDSILDQCTQPVQLKVNDLSTGSVSRIWKFHDGTTSDLKSPIYDYSNSGTFRVELVAYTIHGCKDSVQKDIFISPKPQLTASVDTATNCADLPIQFNANCINCDSIQWTVSDGFETFEPNFEKVFETGGTYSATVTATGEYGCKTSKNFFNSIVRYPTPLAEFETEDIKEPALNGEVRFLNYSKDADTYFWDFGDGSTSDENSPSHSYVEPEEYLIVLIASNEFGCNDTAQKKITVPFYFGLHIPNAISPAHSNFEVSHFLPKGIGLKKYELLIYDDWGNLIWSTTALDEKGRPVEAWDGTFNGVPVQQDAYVWKVTATFQNDKIYEGKEYENGVIKRAGTVTVLR